MFPKIMLGGLQQQPVQQNELGNFHCFIVNFDRFATKHDPFKIIRNHQVTSFLKQTQPYAIILVYAMILDSPIKVTSMKSRDKNTRLLVCYLK